jgi:hypothetical protein
MPALPHHRAGGQAPFTRVKQDILFVLLLFLWIYGVKKEQIRIGILDKTKTESRVEL